MNVYYTVVFEENVVMRKEFSKLVRQTFLCSMIHKICINLAQYAICHDIVHEYLERDPLGSHKVEEDCSTNLTPQKSNYLLFSTNTEWLAPL
ncbi:hypothetical protein D917_07117 [Trichinella nativa]|uniref:Uncharacterized protein n=1 Tax=Trichinella nativa TaxID=6335 RepID=A0A1Y3ETU4_9BILA|nr:hypothetical protein D917_07117 [Trichinella nativa]